MALFHQHTLAGGGGRRARDQRLHRPPVSGLRVVAGAARPRSLGPLPARGRAHAAQPRRPAARLRAARRSSSSTRACPTTCPRSCPSAAALGAFVLLAIVWFISSFLDNIAAAMIGGVMARARLPGPRHRRLRRRRSSPPATRAARGACSATPPPR